MPASCFLVACLAALSVGQAVRAQESSVQIDPAKTKIEFSLGSSLHTVHGTFALKSSALQFDPATGKMGGSIGVDATSGESGNSGRDSRMHREILESAKYPEIVFTPAQTTGALAPNGPSTLEVSGRFRLHGQDHDLKLPVQAISEGQNVQVNIHFVIPYIQWGLKNPSTFILRASDKVEIDIHSASRMESASASR